MPREIADREAIIASLKSLELTAELFAEVNGKMKNAGDLEVIVDGRANSSGKRVGPYVRLLSYDSEEVIMRQGEWGGNTFYLAVSGVLDVFIDVAGGPQRRTEEPYFEELSRLAAVAGSVKVRMLGERGDVPQLMSAADLYCQPNTAPEPFGIAFVEALAAGLPVVTTGFGGALEIVDDRCGVLVRDPSPEAIAAALQRLIDTPALRASLSAAAPGQAHRISDPAARLAEIRDLVRAQIERSSAA